MNETLPVGEFQNWLSWTWCSWICVS